MALILVTSLRAGVQLVIPVLFLVSVGLVLASQLGLSNYGELVAPWLAVLAGVAASVTGAGRVRKSVVFALALAWLALLAPGAVRHVGRPLPVEWLNRQLGEARCAVADDPVVLIATNRLSRQLEAGCPEIWVDVSGRTYDYATDGNSDRTRNMVWQGVIYDYLTSADASVTCRRNTGLSAETLRRLEPARLDRLDRCTVYRFPAPAP